MNDNVIKFRKPKPPKTPNPLLRKLLVIVMIVAAFVIAWGYFRVFG